MNSLSSQVSSQPSRMENRFHIVCEEEGKRIDILLSEKLALTRTKIKHLIDEGHVRIQGKPPKQSLRVKKGMNIEGEIPEEPQTALMPQDIPLRILFEDEYILAIDKPKGMVVHPSFGHEEGTLVNAILAYLQNPEAELRAQGSGQHGENSSSAIRDPRSHLRPGIVHRLDKGTTGVILVAKDPGTQEMLSDLFKKRGVHKVYRAIIEGEVQKEQWTADGSIGRHPRERKKMAVLEQGGRKAETDFKVLKRLKGYTYVEAYPKTGRTHQIRVHLAHIGHPVVGDETYGRKAKHSTDRPFLHAYKISLQHPLKDTTISVEAPVPEDMEGFIEMHRKERRKLKAQG